MEQTDKTQVEKIERLAEFMGWKKRELHDTFRSPYWESDGEFVVWLEVWNPLTDWNHWRQVEEKVMEDEDLWNWFMADFCDEVTTYVQADLPTRVDALLSALDSLKS